MNAIIKIKNLHKSYGNVKALNGVSFEVFEGEVFGLVGPDGAGKTTLMRILCGLIGSSAGEAELFGKNIAIERKLIQKSIGYLSQKFSLYGDLTVDENIEFFAEIHDVTDYEERRNELLNFTRLKDFRKRLADNLSGGMKQKLALACALIHRPKFLFLDEPTTGVDPVSRRDFWKILSDLIKEGITIFVTTPYLDEAERCTRIGLMAEGKIIALDTPENIKKLMDKSMLEIVCSEVRNVAKILQNETNAEIQLFGDRLNIIYDGTEIDKSTILNILTSEGVKISSEKEIQPSLENVFIYLLHKKTIKFNEDNK